MNTYTIFLNNTITEPLNREAEKRRNEKKTSRRGATNTYTTNLDNAISELLN